MKKSLLLTFVLVLALFASTGSAAAENMIFSAHLSDADGGIDSLGQGQATFFVSPNGQSVSYQLIVANIENVSMAHIHAPSGQIVVWLYPATPPAMLIPGRSDGVLMRGTFTAADLKGPLAGMTINDLVTMLESGGAFVNVHTSQVPSGEIRGVIQ